MSAKAYCITHISTAVCNFMAICSPLFSHNKNIVRLYSYIPHELVILEVLINTMRALQIHMRTFVCMNAHFSYRPNSSNFFVRIVQILFWEDDFLDFLIQPIWRKKHT